MLDKRSISLFVVVLCAALSTAADDAADNTTNPPQKHWSFQPIQHSAPPSVMSGDLVRNGIDSFILRRLESESVEPSREADRRTLARRVSLDLLGLPPTPDQVWSFVNDPSPDAYERLIDRLLAAPQYGERWARPWLDLCHYADTDGYLTDQLRPVAWRYRHWLVESLNRDDSFDQFTREQLAGDLLPDATIENMIATGLLRQTLSNREGGADLEEFRVRQVLDRTSMVGTIWLGLTVGCARCHDHFYDPISQRDFYQLYALLDNADEVNLDAPLAGEAQPYAEALPDYRRRRAELIAPIERELDELRRKWELRLLEAWRNPGEDAHWDRQYEVLGLIWGGNKGEGQLEGTEIVKLDPSLRTRQQQDDLLDYFLGHDGGIDPARFAEMKLADLYTKFNDLKSALPKVTRAPTMQAAQNRRVTYVHVRGSFRDKGETVGCGVPACVNVPLDDRDADRLALAKWLVAPDHPLTARVTVNRMWQEFFGRGLVLTSEDFGSHGELPTHPELLDWLASEFRGTPSPDRPSEFNDPPRAWQVKGMHRTMVTSAAYRQTSRPRPDLALRDPDNAWLARQNSLRVSAETVRDAALTVSGLLSHKFGGPGVYPPQPEHVAKEAFGHHEWPVSVGEDRYRRGLYTFLIRTAPFAQGAIFDAPNPNEICTRRDRSNTPLQALTMLNDEVFVEAARALAARVLDAEFDSRDERLNYAFQLCLSRPPSEQEHQRLAAYFDEYLADERDETKSWTGISSVLLNLHEFITRD